MMHPEFTEFKMENVVHLEYEVENVVHHEKQHDDGELFFNVCLVDNIIICF